MQENLLLTFPLFIDFSISSSDFTKFHSLASMALILQT